ncbi:hypothetical protein F8388_000889 [Cannabis sativa]|uniref:RNase H type-1 domain-containing protein n=1 Tax=Cannabis sativa TaxID=3483 RepID=A0A7J6FQ00_CANSA|nr:hypothetical protein F8388_000889 [Cannabis sativa]
MYTIRKQWCHCNNVASSLAKFESIFDPPNHAQQVMKEFNFYIDATVRGISWAYVAVVIFNKDGDFMDALTAKVPSTSAFHAECMALCHAFSLSLKLNCKDANFFSDCLQLVNVVRNFTIPVWNLSNMFLHLFSCLKTSSSLNVSWLSRDANVVAHKLAAWATVHNISRACTEREVAPFVATSF